MAVRLSKIAREFNVGLSTIVEFLHSKGIKISSDPNAKLTDEDYALVAIQMDENPMSAIVSAIDTKVLSMQELQEVVGIAVNYCNDCPRWFLKGHSSTEASALLGRGESVKTPPRIVAGPTMKAAGMDITPKMQTMVDGMFYDTFSGTKIGRNDPCPCGSGKKYKKCCGRDN